MLLKLPKMGESSRPSSLGVRRAAYKNSLSEEERIYRIDIVWRDGINQLHKGNNMYSAKQKSAISELLKHDPHLIRCNEKKLNWTLPEHQTKEKLDKIKDPIKGVSWKKKPSNEEILSHIDEGGLIAIKPSSVNALVFDVDKGNGSGVISELGEPAFVCDSRREGGKHLFYKSTSPVEPG